jgi:hypothetical protein
MTLEVLKGEVLDCPEESCRTGFKDHKDQGNLDQLGKPSGIGNNSLP